MTIERTIEVPADRRVFFEIPKTIPRGMTKIALHIMPLETASSLQENQNSRRIAFQSFMQYRRAAPPGFDYKKELEEALDEKHGCIS
ncbi:MAG: hypothetical protein LBT00_11325 [Spirochaetaceae bacterium]|nr:hypothetical protein [Spirochaetaceae bacterium]